MILEYYPLTLMDLQLSPSSGKLGCRQNDSSTTQFDHHKHYPYHIHHNVYSTQYVAVRRMLHVLVTGSGRTAGVSKNWEYLSILSFRISAGH